MSETQAIVTQVSFCALVGPADCKVAHLVGSKQSRKCHQHAGRLQTCLLSGRQSLVMMATAQQLLMDVPGLAVKVVDL